MDVEATVSAPIAAVFGHLAAAEHLGDWLVGVVGGAWRPGDGAAFALTLRDGGDEATATGDMVAYEPPWQVAYRLCVGPRQRVIWITCTAHGGGTRVHVHQGGVGRPLAVDLTGLARAGAASGALGDPGAEEAPDASPAPCRG